MPPTKDEVMKAFRGIKAHELARYINESRFGVDFSGCSKGFMAQSIATNEYRLHDRIVARSGSFAAWVDDIRETVIQHREKAARDRKAGEERKAQTQKKRDQLLDLLDQMEEGKPLSKEEREFLVEHARTAVRFYYLMRT